MSNGPATPAPPVPVPARPTGTAPADSLAGLIGVLDRVDDVGIHLRGRSRRPAGHQPDAYRRGDGRRTPLRSVPQAPAARSGPAGAAPAVSAAGAPATASPGRLADLVRRMALWGAGTDGEYLAWPAPVPRTAVRSLPAVAAQRTVAAPAQPRPRRPRARRRPSRLRELTRRLALWGAGTDGEYLAWSSARSSPPARSRTGPSSGGRPETDRPVVLREMPSTPTVQPVAPSPAAALLPRGPASSAGSRGARPAPPRAVPVPGVRPDGRLERSGGTGWPVPPRPSPDGTGLVRARGDPPAHPVRRSPFPVRRARSPDSARSSFPPGPVPRSGTGASRI